MSAERIAAAITAAAAGRLHDPTDALDNIALAQVDDGTGEPDPAKIAIELEDLIARKPHLGKPGSYAARPVVAPLEADTFAAYDAAVRMQSTFRGLATPDPAAFGLTRAAVDARTAADSVPDPAVEATLKRITTTERNLGVSKDHLGRRG